MRKFIFLLIAFVAFAFSVNAQESASSDKYLSYDETWFTYTPSSTTYALTLTDSIWYYTALSEKFTPVTVDVKVILDSVGGTSAIVPVVLQGKKWLSDIFTPIDTVNWVTGVDTTINFNTSSEAKYRYWRVYMKGAADGFIVNIDELSMKFWQ
jgi:hypothetical protein